MPMLRPAAMFEPGASTTTSGSSPCSRASASSSSVPSVEPPSTPRPRRAARLRGKRAQQLGELVAVVPDGDHDGDAVFDRGSRAIAVQIGLTSGDVGHAGLYSGHSPIVFGAWYHHLQ